MSGGTTEFIAAVVSRRRALAALCGGAALVAAPAWPEAQAAQHRRGDRPLAVAPPLFSARPVDPAFAQGSYDVRAFGAAGDGRRVDTPAINRAIAAAARDGGGTVHIPAGTYLCYSIHLQSKVSLCLQPGATILAAACQAQGGPGNYDAAEPNPEAGHFEDYGHRHLAQCAD